ncbi:AzlD domain-containing protein [Gracilibacillus alcaliphilus]|uniref:AzlD domain-containing protein n=1 Tax=Gracilibacillus alcaliphilus TaxID=1401441 RepID=UPI001958E0B7|nr:AzlD domain-containing protein [Gracilibacillus alcaliphilus]MBM7679773.1 branched-subunit amino acid transport protein [Gracilibacillus alcaliphilus]
MSVNLSIFLIIAGCAIVTLIPRILPFIMVRSIDLPEVVTKWLSFIPICIFTALIIDSLIVEGGSVPAIDWRVLLAIMPTLLIALWTKSLSITVIIGIISMASIRFFL